MNTAFRCPLCDREIKRGSPNYDEFEHLYREHREALFIERDSVPFRSWRCVCGLEGRGVMHELIPHLAGLSEQERKRHLVMTALRD